MTGKSIDAAGLVSSELIFDWVEAHARRTPDAPAVDSPHHRLTYGELWRRVRDLAGHLADRGVGPGGRVVVALPTSPASVVAALAVQAAGACAVEIDRAMGHAGFATVLSQSRARHAIVAASDSREWGRAQSELFAWAWVLGAGPGRPGPEALGTTPLLPDGALPDTWRGASPPRREGLTPEAEAVVLYTSGSTGTPRGVIQTFRNLSANSRSIATYLGLGPRDRVMAILPFYYCYGRSLLQTHLLTGGSVFIDGRFMYPQVVMEALSSEGCTGFAGVPLTFEILRRDVDLAAFSRPRLRYVTQAGGPMRPETIAWAREAFAPARLFVMYGQTEATARLAYLPPERAQDKAGSIGIAIPGVELQVVDEAGRPLPAGEVGQLVARGANVTPGYLEAPGETAAILHDAWLWTGDLARRDGDGYFFIAGRAKEILKVSGYRVSPIEIENVLAAHPSVAEAAVVGAPDPVQGEVAVAFVVPRKGAAPDPLELRRFCRERLPPYKVPALVELAREIPRNSFGKPLKAELVSRARAALDEENERRMTRFSQEVLSLDLEATAERLAAGIRAAAKRFRRPGVVVAVSGGIDSACVAGLAVRALGPPRVHGLLLPERDSSPESTTLGHALCDAVGIERTVHDIAPALEALGCYRERDDAVRSVVPEFRPGMRWKMVLSHDRLTTGALAYFSAVVELASGETRTERLAPEAYLRILAATNYKQRTRKMIEYFHADRLNYIVAGTPNLLEYDQGFFVKLGDGAADVKPIAGLYKSQVYAVARHLRVPEGILVRQPTTDTYSLPQSQEEFYFSLDYRRLDLLLWAKEHEVSPEEAAEVMDLTADQVRHVYADIDQKRRVAEYLHAPPVLVD